MRIPDSTATFATASATPLSAPKQESSSLSFGDILDTVNPLQHIPVISSIYRSVTGDTMSSAARLAGGGLYGGVVGAASAVVNILSEEMTGKDIASNAVDALTSNETQVYGAQAAQILTPEPFSTPAIVENNPILSKLPTLEDKSFFELSKEKKEQSITALGLDNENIRRQLLGELDEKLYKKL